MYDFIKENIIHILVLLFVSLMFIFGGQILMHKFSKTANFENLENLDDRVRCAQVLGWQIDKTSETQRSVYIPSEMTEEFDTYNQMQKMCGFDLTDYMGKGAICYTYRILNFPSENDVNAFLNIIIYKDKMIGGDCEVLEYDDLYLPVKLIKTDTDVS